MGHYYLLLLLVSTCAMEIINNDGSTNTQDRYNIQKYVFYIDTAGDRFRERRDGVAMKTGVQSIFH